MIRTCVFVGPSLPGLRSRPDSSIEFATPIRRGDLAAAVDRGVGRVGIIDGEFGQALAVSVMEIRRALENGIEVWGASSMGALRAAECDQLGMRGLGWIYERYCDGTLTADDEVALLFHPVTRQALTVPLVNVRWALELATEAAILSAEAAQGLLELARRVHYSERRYELLIRTAQDGRVRAHARALAELVAAAQLRCDRKRLDALMLLRRLEGSSHGGGCD